MINLYESVSSYRNPFDTFVFDTQFLKVVYVKQENRVKYISVYSGERLEAEVYPFFEYELELYKDKRFVAQFVLFKILKEIL